MYPLRWAELDREEATNLHHSRLFKKKPPTHLPDLHAFHFTKLIKLFTLIPLATGELFKFM